MHCGIGNVSMLVGILHHTFMVKVFLPEVTRAHFGPRCTGSVKATACKLEGRMVCHERNAMQ